MTVFSLLALSKEDISDLCIGTNCPNFVSVKGPHSAVCTGAYCVAEKVPHDVPEIFLEKTSAAVQCTGDFCNTEEAKASRLNKKRDFVQKMETKKVGSDRCMGPSCPRAKIKNNFVSMNKGPAASTCVGSSCDERENKIKLISVDKTSVESKVSAEQCHGRMCTQKSIGRAMLSSKESVDKTNVDSKVSAEQCQGRSCTQKKTEFMIHSKQIAEESGIHGRRLLEVKTGKDTKEKSGDEAQSKEGANQCYGPGCRHRNEL